MSSPRIARDEGTRCVSPQRIATPMSSASRGLPFLDPGILLDVERLLVLEAYDPEGFTSIRRMITRRIDRLDR